MRSEKEAAGEGEKDKKRLYYDEKRILAAFRTVLTPKQLRGLAKKTMHFGKQNDVNKFLRKPRWENLERYGRLPGMWSWKKLR